MSTTAEKLAEVEAAISALVTGGQSVRYADRHLVMAELAQLERREEKLRARLAAERRAASGRGSISYPVPE